MSSTPRKKLFFRLLFLGFCTLVLNILTSGCSKVAEENNLEERADGLVYKIGSKTPFTGIRIKFHEELEGRRKAYEFHYEGGLLNGPSETYYLHGITESKGEYIVIPQKGSVKHGTFYSWRKNGTLVHKKSYKHGELHGPQILYHDKWTEEKREVAGNGNQPEEDAIVQEEIHYVNGLKDGPYERLQRDGSLLETGSYRNGQFDGEQVYYFPSIRGLAVKDHLGFNRPGEFPASAEGFTRAKARANSLYESIPLSRNPEKKPASVAGFDADAKLLTIVWNTEQDEAISWNDISKPRPKYRRVWQNGKVIKTSWHDPQDQRFLFQKNPSPGLSSQ